MGGSKTNSTDFKTNFDLVQKSEAKIFGQVLEDFQFLESVTMWSDLCNFGALEKRESMVTLPARVA